MIVDITRLLNGIDGNPLTGEALLGRGNDFLSSLTDGRVQVNAVEVQETVLNAVKSIAELFLNFLTSSVGGIGSTVTSIIIFMYVYSSLLSGGDKLVAYMKKLNPLGDEVSDLYIRQAGLMTKSMVVVQIVVAMVQGLIGAVSLKLAGIDYFIFFAVILSVLSIIPLGGGILTIPIGIITILTGNIFGGVIILLVHFVVVTNIDNLLKAKLLSNNSSMHPALVMISILSGITLFGFMGIIIGPVLMILALTTLDVYKRTAKRRI